MEVCPCQMSTHAMHVLQLLKCLQSRLAELHRCTPATWQLYLHSLQQGQTHLDAADFQRVAVVHVEGVSEHAVAQLRAPWQHSLHRSSQAERHLDAGDLQHLAVVHVQVVGEHAVVQLRAPGSTHCTICDRLRGKLRLMASSTWLLCVGQRFNSQLCEVLLRFTTCSI